ncbi:hypothetical protein HPB50_022017 [Hyalomma asiaticum]|uniref:Uncharacterized protein n=1 Tax=Hyalomma asiaticum TaxID=266040 RepID=A0ACB7SYE5_HYAAI|nr:hypothetical protein HPB50_022017 [Hyalomma asiaticum]
MSEFLWRNVLLNLPKKPSAACHPQKIQKIGGGAVPESVEQVLAQGPKFSVAPKVDKTELLALKAVSSGHLWRVLRNVSARATSSYFNPTKRAGSWSWRLMFTTKKRTKLCKTTSEKPMISTLRKQRAL